MPPGASKGSSLGHQALRISSQSTSPPKKENGQSLLLICLVHKKEKNWLQKLIRFKKVCFEANVCNACVFKVLIPLRKHIEDFGPEPGLVQSNRAWARKS